MTVSLPASNFSPSKGNGKLNQKFTQTCIGSIASEIMFRNMEYKHKKGKYSSHGAVVVIVYTYMYIMTVISAAVIGKQIQICSEMLPQEHLGRKRKIYIQYAQNTLKTVLALLDNGHLWTAILQQGTEVFASNICENVPL